MYSILPPPHFAERPLLPHQGFHYKTGSMSRRSGPLPLIPKHSDDQSKCIATVKMGCKLNTIWCVPLDSEAPYRILHPTRCTSFLTVYDYNYS